MININFIFQSEGDSVAESRYRFNRVLLIPTRSISINPEKSYVNEDCNENDEMGEQRH